MKDIAEAFYEEKAIVNMSAAKADCWAAGQLNS